MKIKNYLFRQRLTLEVNNKKIIMHSSVSTAVVYRQSNKTNIYFVYNCINAVSKYTNVQN